MYRLKGDLDRAREIGEKGAEGLTVTVGPTDVLTIRYVIQLCRTYFECGLYAEAQTLLEDTLKTADEAIGAEESTTLHGRDLLGNFLHAKGELDTAEALLRDVLRLMLQRWGEGWKEHRAVEDACRRCALWIRGSGLRRACCTPLQQRRMRPFMELSIRRRGA